MLKENINYHKRFYKFYNITKFGHSSIYGMVARMDMFIYGFEKPSEKMNNNHLNILYKYGDLVSRIYPSVLIGRYRDVPSPCQNTRQRKNKIILSRTI